MLDKLTALAAEKPDDYLDFYRQFGPTLKEGVAVDPPTATGSPSSSGSPRRTPTTREPHRPRRLPRSGPADQKAIYFLGGPDLASIRKSPNLEIFRKRGVEVLLLTDPIDEFVVTSLHSFDGKDLVSIDSSDIELPEAERGAEPEPKPTRPRPKGASAASSTCSARPWATGSSRSAPRSG